MFPVPATVPDGVKSPVLLMVPSSPRSRSHFDAAVAVPPTSNLNCTVGAGWPVTTVIVGAVGVMARELWDTAPSGPMNPSEPPSP